MFKKGVPMVKRFIGWFNNHSLRFKLTALFLLVLVVMQFVSGVLVTNVVEKKLRNDILLSYQGTLEQMAANVDETLMNIVEDLYPVLQKARSAHSGAGRAAPAHAEDAAPAQPDGETRVDAGTVDTAGSDLAYVNNNIEYQNLFNQLQASRNNYRYIHSMLVLDAGGQVYSYFASGYSSPGSDNLFSKLEAAYGPQGDTYIWTDVLDDGYFFSRNSEQIVSLVVPVRNYRNIRSFVVLNLSVQRLHAYVANMAGESTRVFLQTLGGAVITDSGTAGGLDDADGYHALLADTGRSRVEDAGGAVLLTHRLTVNGWPLSLLYSDTRTDGVALLTRTLIPLLVGVVLIMMASSGFIVGEVTKPLRKLTSIMRSNARTRDKAMRFNAQYRDEVGVLGAAYNQMMDDLEEEQRQSRVSYMKMLQMQIKPHFLYNSMESTRFLIEMNDPKAVDMIRAIVTYYKLSLSGVNEVVAIREEVEHLDCYLEILQIRYASRYAYTIDMDEAVLEDEIEKFTLQPLVENAVYHGIKMKRGKGLIRIRGWREDGTDYIEILDNGIGIPQGKLHALQQSLQEAAGPAQADHIGVLNVHQRLRLRYGPGFGLSIQSVEGEYTRVRVTVPANRHLGLMEGEGEPDD